PPGRARPPSRRAARAQPSAPGASAPPPAATGTGPGELTRPTRYSSAATASEATVMPPIHQNQVPYEIVAPKMVTEPALLLISGVHEPDSVAITPTSEASPPMIEQAQNTAAWPNRRAWTRASN